jgi:hypothetical protein
VVRYNGYGSSEDAASLAEMVGVAGFVGQQAAWWRDAIEQRGCDIDGSRIAKDEVMWQDDATRLRDPAGGGKRGRPGRRPEKPQADKAYGRPSLRHAFRHRHINPRIARLENRKQLRAHSKRA